MTDTIKINYLQKTIYALTAAVALKQIAKSSENMPLVKKNLSEIITAIRKLDSNIQVVSLDKGFFTTSLDNWNTVLDCVWNILKWFPWKMEQADCDNRSAFMTAMCSILFGLNTCAGAYCEVINATTGKTIGLHWANLIIDENNNIILFDPDNGGMRQKITTNNCVMGNWKYRFISARVY